MRHILPGEMKLYLYLESLIFYQYPGCWPASRLKSQKQPPFVRIYLRNVTPRRKAASPRWILVVYQWIACSSGDGAWALAVILCPAGPPHPECGFLGTESACTRTLFSKEEENQLLLSFLCAKYMLMPISASLHLLTKILRQWALWSLLDRGGN